MDGQAEQTGATSRWKRYGIAATGFREYWYPIAPSSRVKRKPLGIQLLGQKIALVRENGRVYAVEDRCPHRGVPFSGCGTPLVAKLDFTGHITCPYHGWVFDLSSGRLAAALTDGPDSPMIGKCALRTYPVEERCGLVWIWMGEKQPVPVEDDIPAELLQPNARVYARFTLRKGNWRYAAENGFDEGHQKYLHRRSLWTMMRRIPSYNRTRITKEADGKWISRVQEATHFESDYPGLGKWPRYHFWNFMYHPSGDKGRPGCSIRLPGMLRVLYRGWNIYEWYMPVDPARHIYLQMNVAWVGGFKRLRWWLYYHLFIRGIQHTFLNNQDAWVIELMPDTHPERFYRPDISITTWRRFCEETARDFIDAADEPESEPADPPKTSTTSSANSNERHSRAAN